MLLISKFFKTVLTASLFFALLPSYAAEPLRHSVKVWSTDQGLPQSTVLALLQTSDGYLWLGTLNELVRFDGLHFQVFDQSNTPEMDTSPIVQLHEDSQGRIWAGMESGRILIVKPDGSVTRTSMDAPLPETPGSRLASIVDGPGGDVWVYTVDGRVGRYRDNRMDIWATPGISRTRRAIVDGGHLLWIASDLLLSAYGPLPNQGTELPAQFQLRPGKIDYLLPSRDGGYWLLAAGHVQKWSTNRLEKDFGAYPWAPEIIVSAATEDLDGNLIIGTYGNPGAGVFWYDSNGAYQQIQGLSHDSVFALVVDREGCLWVGTNGGGLNRVTRQLFDVVPGSRGSTVLSVSPDSRGGLWVAYNGDRVDYVPDGGAAQSFTNIVPRTSQPQEIAARAILVDARQNVWLGIQSALSRLERRSVTPSNDPWQGSAPGLLRLEGQAFAPVEGFEIANQQVSVLFQDKAANLWVGTKGGAIRWDRQNWKTFTTLDGLTANSVQAIAQDAKDQLWIGTDRGLNCLTPGTSGATSTIRIFTRSNGLPSDNVLSILVAKSGILWVGTSAGLARFTDGRWTSYTTRNGLAGNSIGFLAEDNHDHLWLGSRSGLMRVSFQSLDEVAEGRSETLSLHTYGKSDGLPTRECSQGCQPATASTPDGRLWFSTIAGLASVNPDHIQKNPLPPSIVLESLFFDSDAQTAPGIRSPLPSLAVVPAKRQSFEIRFTILSLAAPDEVRYRYRLDGWEDSWTDGQGNTGVAHYSKISPGQYTLLVQACNEDEVWNYKGVSLAILVLTPFWKTGWFLGLVAATLLGVVVISVHYVSTQRLQRQLALLKQQEMVEKERARIARDLHDQLGANLTQITLLGEMAESDKNLPAEVEDHARQICHTARETTRSLDEIVWTVNPANDTLEGLLNYICKYSQEYLELAGMRYRVEIPPHLPPRLISPELRHNAFLVVKEAINNLVKHSGATSAWLKLQLRDNEFELEIADDGRGLPPDAKTKGRSGLRNMQKRMHDVNGQFSIRPRPEGGTIVTLSAPLPAPEPQTGNEST